MTGDHSDVARAVSNRELSAADALGIVGGTAEELRSLHNAGRVHRRVTAESISIEHGSRQVRLAPPRPEPVSFGGNVFDQEQCPPELRHVPIVTVPENLAEAGRILRAAQVEMDPRRIDVYQLGVLLWRVFTDKPVGLFLSSPRSRKQIPDEQIRILIERALGHNAQNRIADFDQFLDEFHQLAAVTQESAHESADGSAPERPQCVAAEDDTAPSVVSGKPEPETDLGFDVRSPVPAAEDLPFSRLGHYEITGRIGSGGMGDVYKGYDRALNRDVAIKVLPSEFARDEEFVKRFYAEATAAAKLEHPHIVRIHYIGQDNDLYYFAMQYVEGESLAEILSRRERLGVEETLAIVEQALSGLSAAHRRDFVHRDIKPGNILIDRHDQRVLLADFGLVKSLAEISRRTATGVIMGTVDYISPEQGRGQPVDGRSDLYSLGVLMYRMLSGRLPFEADSPTAMIFQHVYETPPSLQLLVPHIPPALVAIVEKLMRKSADDRYQTAEEVLEDLQALQAGEPLPSGADVFDPDAEDFAVAPRVPPVETVAGGEKEAGRKTMIITAPHFPSIGDLPDALEHEAPTGRWGRIKRKMLDAYQEHAPEFVRQLENTQQQVDGAVAEYSRRQRRLRRLIGEADGVLEELQTQEQQWRQAAEEGRATAESASDDKQVAEAGRKQAQCKQEAGTLQEQIRQQQGQLESMRLQLSKVTATLEKLRNQRGLLNARMKVARARLHVAGGAAPLTRWRRVLSSRRGIAVIAALFAVAVVLFYWNLPAPEPVAETSRYLPGEPGYSGAEVDEAAAANAPALEPIITVTDEAPLLQYAGHEKTVHVVAVSPTENQFASAGEDSTIRLWDIETGRELKTLRGAQGTVNALEFTSDGKYLISGAGGEDAERTLLLWDVNAETIIRPMIGRTSSIEDLALHPDGETLAALHHSRELTDKFSIISYEVKLWNIRTGQPIHTIVAEFLPMEIAFSPDGTVLAIGTTEGQIQLWDVAERKVTKTLGISPPQYRQIVRAARSNRTIRSLLFRGDATTLATGHFDGSVTFWNIAEGTELFSFGGFDEGGFTPLCFSPDGSRLVSADMAITDLRTMQLRHKKYSNRAILAAAFDHSGRILITGGQKPYLLKWDAGTGPAESSEPVATVEEYYRPRVAVARSRNMILVAGGGQAGIWNPTANNALQSFEKRHPGMVTQVAISPDERLLVAGGIKGWLSLWDIESGKLLHQAKTVRNGRDQQRQLLELATLKNEMRNIPVDQRAELQEIIDRHEAAIESRQNSRPQVSGLAFTPDSQHVVISTGETVYWWDVATGAPDYRYADLPRGIIALAVSPDGRYFATGERAVGRDDAIADVRLWDLQTGEHARRLVGNVGSVRSLAFARGGRYLLSAGRGAVHLWDVETGEVVRRFVAPRLDETSIRAIAVSPDETMVAAAGAFRIGVWNFETGNPVYRFDVRRSARFGVTNIAFSGDGRYVFSGHLDDTVRMWEISAPVRQW